MADRNGNERIVNVKVCHRIGGKESILVCARCGNEVEAKPNVTYWMPDARDGMETLVPRGNFCQWCGVELQEANNG